MPDLSPSPTFWVRDVPIHGDVILAPMDGYSDWPFRSLCRALGSAMSYTEFVKAEKIVHKIERVHARLAFEEVERPVVFQIYGDDADLLLEAALRVQEFGPDIIDINMGCPAKSVAHRGAGVGLMRTPLEIARIFRKLSAALEVPVTGKLRLGWKDCPTGRLVARIVEENGGSLIAVHGRFKEQGYAGPADWDAIAELRAAVKIPVIGNGDVVTVADIDRMKTHTGCPAVMVGRAAVGNPWIFARLDRDRVPPEEVRRFARKHLERNMRFYGDEDGQRLFRKHVIEYCLLRNLTRTERKDILREKPAEEMLALLAEVEI